MKKSFSTIQGTLAVALLSILVLTGAGLTPTGNQMNTDINGNGFSLTNAATINATNGVFSGGITGPVASTNLTGLGIGMSAALTNAVNTANGLVQLDGGGAIPIGMLGNYIGVSGGVQGYAAPLTTLGAGNPFTFADFTVTGTWPNITLAPNFGTTGSTFAIGNDTRFPASVTGLRKSAGAGSTDTAATAGTDYQIPITLTTTGTSGAATFSAEILNIPQYPGTVYAAGTGLTLSTGTFSVNTSQNIATLSNLTSDGFVTTSGAAGTLASSWTIAPTSVATGATAVSIKAGAATTAGQTGGTLTIQAGQGGNGLSGNGGSLYLLAGNGATMAGTVNVGTVGAKAPGINIAGTILANSAVAGTVGEIITSAVASGGAIALTTGTPANVTSMALTAGDWDVQGNVNFTETSATVSGKDAAIDLSSATLPTDGTEVYSGAVTTALSSVDSITLPRKQINISTPTTVYLVAQTTFTAGTVAAFGSITARRVR